MARRMQKSTWRDGYRRSPRIWALAAQNAHRRRGTFDSQNNLQMQEEDSRDNYEQGPPSRTRARLKRKIEGVTVNSVATKTKQNRETPNLEDHSTNSGQPSVASFMPSMPEKQILELILDVLQRRDTYEIFAEPVDPNEVEDYYEIIKEPMDFGTMRAKLHEGMYRNLEQFERDVFLISRNAMHFNSTGSMYFRQARAIQELAKKVFHVLKTDPENFELEFSGTRRRSARRPLVQTKNSRLSSYVRHSSLAINISSKRTPCPSNGPSIFRKKTRETLGFFSSAVDTTDCDFFSGHREGRKSSFAGEDRRCTYRPWKSYNDNNSAISTLYRDPISPKLDISYTESLMAFVKDLGPTAQMIARRKLQGLREDAPTYPMPSSYDRFQASKYQVPAAVALDRRPPTTLDTTFTPASQKFSDPLPRGSFHKSIGDIIDLTESEDGEVPNVEDRVGNHGTAGGENTPNNKASTTSDGRNVSGVSRGGKIAQNQSTETQLDLNVSSAGDLNSSIAGVKDGSAKSMMTVNMDYLPENMQPLILNSENSQSIETQFKLRNKNRSPSSPWLSRSNEVLSLSQTGGSMNGVASHSQATTALGPNNEVYCLSQAGKSLESNRPKPLGSQFTFDLRFLKSKLNQMNVVGRDGYYLKPGYQKGFDLEGPLFERKGYKRGSNFTNQAEPSTKAVAHQRLLRATLDALDTDLALQL